MLSSLLWRQPPQRIAPAPPGWRFSVLRLSARHGRHKPRRSQTLCGQCTLTVLAVLSALVAVQVSTGADAPLGTAEQRLGEVVRYLSSDTLEGRGVDTGGIQKAADYLVGQFQALGLRTSVFEAGAFQLFTVATGAELGPQEENRLVLIGPAAEGDTSPRRRELKLGEEFQSLAIGGTGKAAAPVVFAGYGITAPQQNYDDYAGVDVKGSVVLLLRKEPQQEDPQSVFNGRRSSFHAQFSAKIANAFEHGAAAVILVNDNLSVTQSAAAERSRWKESLDRIVGLRDKLNELADPSTAQLAEHRAEVLKVTKDLATLDERFQRGFDEVLALDGAGFESSHGNLPVFFARRQALDEMVRAATGSDLAALEAKIDQGPAPCTQVLSGWSVDCQASVVHRSAEVKNVAAILDGAAPWRTRRSSWAPTTTI